MEAIEPSPALNSRASEIYAYLRKLVGSASFGIFNLSAKDVVGFYRGGSEIGQWHCGSPLIHQGDFLKIADSMNVYTGSCNDKHNRELTQYVMAEGPPLVQIGKDLVRFFMSKFPEWESQVPTNPTLFMLTKEGRLPLHRDFDSGYRLIVNLDPYNDAHLDFEHRRADLKPLEPCLFSTNEWHGLNVREPKQTIFTLTVCLDALSAERWTGNRI